MRTRDLGPGEALALRGLYADEPDTPGASLDPSRRWVDGDPTDEVLAGTSCIALDRGVEHAVSVARKYGDGGRVALVRGTFAGYGEDRDEVLIADAVVVSLVEVHTALGMGEAVAFVQGLSQ